MSEFTVPVVRIETIKKHPDADTLSITEAEGNPCIIRTGDLEVGDLAIYIPVDAVISDDTRIGNALSFLKWNAKGKHRVKAMRLRGIFSMGILVKATTLFPSGSMAVPAPVDEVVLGPGMDLSQELGIVKYEEQVHGATVRKLGGQQERDPGLMPIYGLDNYRKFKHVFTPEQEVVVTEKLHGCNARFVHDGETLWVGSHKTWKKLDGDDVWNEIAKKYDLAIKLARYPKVGIFGEVFGSVQDLRYGMAGDEIDFRLFDVYDVNTGKYQDWAVVEEMAANLGLQTVPVLYRGSFNAAVIEPLASGMDTVSGTNIREGVVIKTAIETFNPRTIRTTAKLVSEEYLLRKNGTEFH